MINFKRGDIRMFSSNPGITGKGMRSHLADLLWRNKNSYAPTSEEIQRSKVERLLNDQEKSIQSNWKDKQALHDHDNLKLPVYITMNDELSRRWNREAIKGKDGKTYVTKSFKYGRGA